MPPPPTDDKAFPLALKQITGGGGPKLQLSAASIAPGEINAFEESKSKDINVIDSKLVKVPTLKTKAKLIECRRDYLKRYLYRENLLEELRKRHPPLREKIDEFLTAKGEDMVQKPLERRLLINNCAGNKS